MVWKISNRESHQSVVLQNVSTMRDKFCDVNLKVGEVLIPAHKLILSAACPFFHNMFTSVFSESKSSEVELSDMTVESVEVILEYIYSGELKCRDMDLLLDLYRAIDFLQMQPLQDLTYNLIVEKLTVESCLKAWDILGQLNKKQEAVIDFISSQLDEIVRNEDFLVMNFEKFQLLLRQLVENYKLRPGDKNSDRFYEAVVAWTSHDLEGRKDSLSELLMILNTGDFSGKLIGKLRSVTLLQDNVKRMKWLNDVVFERYENILSEHEQRIFNVMGDGAVMEFHTNTHCVTKTTSNIKDLIYFGVLSSKKKIYIIGGRNISKKEFSKLCYTYDTEKFQWDHFEFPYIVCAHQICAVHQIIYIFGGILTSGNGYVPKVVKYDMETHRLTECSPMPYATRYFSICQNGGQIFLTYINAECEISISQYLSTNDVWLPFKQEKRCRYTEDKETFSTQYFKGKIYLLSHSGGVLFSYCLKINSWKELTKQLQFIGRISYLMSTRDKLYVMQRDCAYVYENGNFVSICSFNLTSNAYFRPTVL